MKLKASKAALLSAGLLTVFAAAYSSGVFSARKKTSIPNEHIHCTPEHHVCVMKTIFDLEKDQFKPDCINPVCGLHRG